jgi:hypothetical protein
MKVIKVLYNTLWMKREEKDCRSGVPPVLDIKTGD